MQEATERNLRDAFAGESQAHMKYLSFSEAAKKEGKQNLARLFAAAAFSEQVHAGNHLKALNGVGESSENLKAAWGGENSAAAPCGDRAWDVEARAGLTSPERSQATQSATNTLRS